MKKVDPMWAPLHKAWALVVAVATPLFFLAILAFILKAMWLAFKFGWGLL